MSFLSQLSNASSSVTGAAQSSNSADDKEEVNKDSLADAKSSCVMSIHVTCANCSSSLSENWCGTCKNFAICCCICQEGIKGSAVYCPSCMHGGHSVHIKQWFLDDEQIDCPTGCGCVCSEFIRIDENREPQSGESFDSDEDSSVDNSSSAASSNDSESNSDDSSSSSSSSKGVVGRNIPVHKKVFK
jgi:hypothetical protein